MENALPAETLSLFRGFVQCLKYRPYEISKEMSEVSSGFSMVVVGEGTNTIILVYVKEDVGIWIGREIKHEIDQNCEVEKGSV